VLTLSFVLIFLFFFVSVIFFRKLINPFFIFAFPVFLYLIFGSYIRGLSIDDPRFIFSDVIINIYLLTSLVSCVLTYKLLLGIDVRINRRSLFFYESDFLYALAIFALCFLVLLPVLYSYGLSFNGFRAFYHDIRYSSDLASIYYLVSILCPLLILMSYSKRKYILMCFLFFTMLALGKKQLFLSTMFLLAGYHELIAGKNLANKTPHFFLFFVFMIVLQILFSSADQSNLMLVSGYFDIYPNMSHVLSFFHETSDYLEGEILLTSFWFAIPRLLFESKPTSYGVTLIHDTVYPNLIGSGYTPGIFSPIVGPYADFGLWFLVIFTFFKSSVLTFVYYIFTKRKTMLLFILYVTNLNFVPVLRFLPAILLRGLFGNEKK